MRARFENDLKIVLPNKFDLNDHDVVYCSRDVSSRRTLPRLKVFASGFDCHILLFRITDIFWVGTQQSWHSPLSISATTSLVLSLGDPILHYLRTFMELRFCDLAQMCSHIQHRHRTYLQNYPALLTAYGKSQGR